MAETVPEGAEAMQRPLLAVSSTEAACQGVLYTFKTGCTFLPAPASPLGFTIVCSCFLQFWGRILQGEPCSKKHFGSVKCGKYNKSYHMSTERLAPGQTRTAGTSSGSDPHVHTHTHTQSHYYHVEHVSWSVLQILTIRGFKGRSQIAQAFTKHLLWTMMSNFLGSTGEVISTSK